MIATDITDRIVALCGTITVANGYTLDLGNSVVVGRSSAGEPEAPAIYVMPGADTAEAGYGHTQMRREYRILAYAEDDAVDGVSAWGLVDAMIWDIRRCLEAYDASIAALNCTLMFQRSEPGYREPGGSLVGAAVTYTALYTIDPLSPD
jgi:hypothetical protein